MFVVCVSLLFLSSVQAEIVVTTTTASVGCPDCLNLVNLIKKVGSDFPQLKFQTVEFDYERGLTNTELPYTRAEVDGRTLEYKLSAGEDSLHRWLTDVKEGRETELVRTVPMVSNWTSGHESWVHVLSERPPALEYYANTMLQTAFAWSPMNGTHFDNTVIAQALDGHILMEHNVTDLRGIFRQLLPPIVPFWMSKLREVSQILAFFDAEVYIVSPSSLDLDLSRHYPAVAWIQSFGNESEVVERELPLFSTWVWKRQVAFMLPAVGVEILDWYREVEAGLVEPHYRPSEPVSSLLVGPGLVELSGDDVWAWLRGEEDRVLYQYSTATERDAEVEEKCRAAFGGVSFEVGRINMLANDHESFPEQSGPGSVHYYHNGTYITSGDCSETSQLIEFIEMRQRVLSEEFEEL